MKKRRPKPLFLSRHKALFGALGALLFWALTSPARLVQTLRLGLQLGKNGSWFYGLAYVAEAALVARWMRHNNLAILHVHFGNASATVGVLVKRLTQCHLSYTIHGPDEFDDVFGQHLALKMQEADQVVCISQFAKGQLMRLSHPDHWHKFQVCRLGVDPAQFAFAERALDTSPGRIAVCRPPVVGQGSGAYWCRFARVCVTKGLTSN